MPSAGSSSDTATESQFLVNLLGARMSWRMLSPKYRLALGSHSVAYSKNSFKSCQLP